MIDVTMELEGGFGAAGAIGQSIAVALHRVIMDHSALQRLIGPIAKTPYPEGIRQTLAATRQIAAG